MTPSLLCRTILLVAMLLGAAACDRKPPPGNQATPPAEAQATPPAEAQAAPPAASDKESFTFGDGFHKEEASPAATLRWVRQDAAFHLVAPAEGRYRLTFRPFTVFSTVENTIGIRVNEQPAGSFSTRFFDVTQPVPTVVEVSLRAGDNELRLHSKGPEVRLGENDDRLAAYGLVMPILVERVP